MSNEWKPLNGIVEGAEAVAAGMEIEVMLDGVWRPISELEDCFAYRARLRKPTKVQVKSLCYREAGGNLTWRNEGAEVAKCWERFPAGDISGEVET